MGSIKGDPVGMHRVLEPTGVLPQAALRLDTSPDIRADEVRVRVERLNLDAASFRQLERKHDGDGAAVRDEVLEIVRTRGKMHNPVTGSGGMLVGRVEEVGEDSPLGLLVGDRVATLVSLTLTPLVIEDDLAEWDGRSEQVPTNGYAILFGRSIAARLPDDLPVPLALAVMDVCGAPALTERHVRRYESSGRRRRRRCRQVRVAVPGRGQARRCPAHHRRRAPPGGGRPAGSGRSWRRPGRRGGRVRRPRPRGAA